MDTAELLEIARTIWGDKKFSLEEIIVLLNVVSGDISRIARDKSEGRGIKEIELKKELGNIMFSTIRWCDDLGYSHEECIQLAIEAQKNYQVR